MTESRKVVLYIATRLDGYKQRLNISGNKMRQNLLYILTFFLIGCDSNVPRENPTPLKETKEYSNVDTSTKTNSKTIIAIQKNYKDNNGQKQGIWDVIENGYLKGFKTYKDDKLNGLHRQWINYRGQIIEGNYINGLKDGLWKHYENDTNLILVSKYYKDTSLWVGFPLADNNYHTPIKGFNIYSDSVLIECPYANGTIWYQGLFLNKKPVGIHKMYFPNKKLKFEHNYKTDLIKVYNNNGKLIEEKKDDIGKNW